MYSKLHEYRAIAEQTALDITKRLGNWTRFLDMAALMYKYPFPDQLLIFAQKPEATAVAPINIWNEKFGRWVRYGTRAIRLIDDSGSHPNLVNVFDVSDTDPRYDPRPVTLWEMAQDHKELILDELDKSYDDISENLPGSFGNIAKQLAREYYEDNVMEIRRSAENSLLEEYDDFNLGIAFEAALSNSIAYTLMSRCGLNTAEHFVDEDFQIIFDFNTPDMAYALGTATNELSAQVLRDIEIVIKKYERQKAVERRIENERDYNVHTQGGLPDSGHHIDRASEGADGAAGQIWEDEEVLPQGTQNDNIQHDAAQGDIVPSPAGDRSSGDTAAGSGDEAAGGESDTARQGSRPDGLDSGDERTEIASGRDGIERTDLHILDETTQINEAEETLPRQETPETGGVSPIPETLSQVGTNFEEVLKGSAITADDIDTILRDGGNGENSIMRIASHFSKKLSVEEDTAFLRSDYLSGRWNHKESPGGKGYRIGGREISVWFDDSGITFGIGKSAITASDKATITWEQAAERVRELYDSGHYISHDTLEEALHNESKELAGDLHEAYGNICRGLSDLHFDLRKKMKPEHQKIAKNAWRERNYLIAGLTEYAEKVDEALSGETEITPERAWELYSESIEVSREMPQEWGFDKIWSEALPQIASLLDDKAEGGSYEGILTRLREDIAAIDAEPGIPPIGFYHSRHRLLGKLEKAGLPIHGFPVTENLPADYGRFITDDEIDNHILKIGYDTRSRLEILSCFLKGSQKERQNFLKHERGHSGGSWTGGGHYDHTPGGGTELKRPGCEDVRISWLQAAKRVQTQIESGRFPSQDDILQIPRYERLMIARNIKNFYHDLYEEYDSPFLPDLNLNSPGDEDWAIIDSLLDDSEKVEIILGEMEYIFANTLEEDRYYEVRREAFYNLREYNEGTFSLFPGLDKIVVKRPQAIERLQTVEIDIPEQSEYSEQLTFFNADEIPDLPSVQEQQQRIEATHTIEPADAEAIPAITRAEIDTLLQTITDDEKGKIVAQFSQNPRSHEAVLLIKEIYKGIEETLPRIDGNEGYLGILGESDGVSIVRGDPLTLPNKHSQRVQTLMLPWTVVVKHIGELVESGAFVIAETIQPLVAETIIPTEDTEILESQADIGTTEPNADAEIPTQQDDITVENIRDDLYGLGYVVSDELIEDALDTYEGGFADYDGISDYIIKEYLTEYPELEEVPPIAETGSLQDVSEDDSSTVAETGGLQDVSETDALVIQLSPDKPPPVFFANWETAQHDIDYSLYKDRDVIGYCKDGVKYAVGRSGNIVYTTQTTGISPLGDVLGSSKIPMDIWGQINAYRNSELSDEQVRQAYIQVLSDYKAYRATDLDAANSVLVDILDSNLLYRERRGELLEFFKQSPTNLELATHLSEHYGNYGDSERLQGGETAEYHTTEHGIHITVFGIREDYHGFTWADVAPVVRSFAAEWVSGHSRENVRERDPLPNPIAEALPEPIADAAAGLDGFTEITDPDEIAEIEAIFGEGRPEPLLTGTNFQITDEHLGEGGAKSKYRNNIAAITTLMGIESANRSATHEEQQTLSRYVGWGGLPQVFDANNSQWTNEHHELQNLLSPEEYESARASTLNAHYTSPVVIKSIYETVGRIGFKSGNILEPSCGIGNFFGLLPESMRDSRLYGVELDGITTRIAKQLYPKASIQHKGFEKTDTPDAFFDLVVGNVPFGNYGVVDKRYDRHKFSIHDYFFAKSLDKVRPGGIIALITSKFTMDKQNPDVRRYMAQRADLLGAVRLPNNAFLKNAGTETTMDILFLQKRDRPMDIEPAWVHLGYTADGIPANRYFVDHPEMVLGRIAFDENMNNKYGGKDSTACFPIEGEDLAEQLEKAMLYIQGEYTVAELDDIEGIDNHAIPADPSVKNFSYALVITPKHDAQGNLFAQSPSEGRIYFRENSLMYPVELPATTLERIKGMIALRDCVHKLIDLQLYDHSDEEIQAQQALLDTLYGRFSAEFGLINSTANSRAFKADNSYYLLSSLEMLDEDGNLERKADIFFKRTIKQRTVVTHVDTASEALAVSIGEKACVDIEYMSELTGRDEESLYSELRGVIFRDYEGFPNGKYHYLTADEFLSGNVRARLNKYQQALTYIPESSPEHITIRDNLAALENALPKELSAAEISVRLGTTWIAPEYVQEFMYKILETPHSQRRMYRVSHHELTGEWHITNKGRAQFNDIATTVTYGTGRMNAFQIISDTLNLRDVRVYDYITDLDGKERRVLNKKETTLVQQKQEIIKQAFKDWIWENPERRQHLVELYNERFNSVRPREYDGSHISFSGISPEIAMQPHQLNAIARILYGGNTLLAHVMGAGKTFQMVGAAMEAKRLGLCNKSLFAVPNHLTEQWAGEFLRLYPSANILVATKKDFEMRNRKKFCAKIATGDYDAVIIGHSQLEKIPISLERQKRHINDQIFEIEQGIDELIASGAEKYTIKQLEKTKKTLEARLERLLVAKKRDDVVTFEQLGVDRLFVDEAHNFKNMFLYTKMRNVAGLSTSEAQKSSDLFLKCRYIDEITGNRGVIFATGTPISNSMTEMYTMQRYLQFDLLAEKRLAHFDCWASIFGETQVTLELAPEGTSYRARTRFAKFHNLPELMAMFKQVADIQTADMLNLPVPEAVYENVIVEPSELQEEMVQELSERARKVQARLVEPREDNMLKITTDGRKIGLDQRLMNPLLPDFEGSKVNACTENVFRIWEDTKEDRLTQLVFSDFSTPNKDGRFNIYDDIREKLILRGIPENEIAFIHEADTEAKKKELFSKVRHGKVRIVLGSTFKLGAGTNIQDRLIASHDIDCPWRPADLEQRAGRIVRQGNKNDEVKIFRYATSKTFDSYLWVRHEVA